MTNPTRLPLGFSCNVTAAILEARAAALSSEVDPMPSEYRWPSEETQAKAARRAVRDAAAVWQDAARASAKAGTAAGRRLYLREAEEAARILRRTLDRWADAAAYLATPGPEAARDHALRVYLRLREEYRRRLYSEETGPALVALGRRLDTAAKALDTLRDRC